MQRRPQTVEAVLFFNEQGICKQMLFAEFEAVLDGVVNLSDYASQSMRAAFVLVAPNLHARAVVFFLLKFDAQGAADRHWNIPLRQLAERGDLSLDLGGGPIRLTSASRCSDPALQAQLWEPIGSAVRNDLLLIRDALHRNPLGVLCDEVEQPFVESRPAVTSAERWYKPGAFAGKPVVAVAHTSAFDEVDEDAELAEEEDVQQRLKAARLIKQQRVLLNNLNQQCEDLKREHDVQRLAQQAEHKRLQAKRQREYEKLTNKHNLAFEEQKLEHARRLEELQRVLSKQLGELQRDLRLQVDINNRLLGQLSQQAGGLQLLQQQVLERQDQVTELLGKLAGQEPSEALSRLAAQGVVFVAFHPGAGHLSIPVADLARYQDNPMAYAAGKCSVSPERYRQWLRHYQTPRCEVPGADGKPCNMTLSRVDNPSRFAIGESNCCAAHKAALLTPG